MTNVVVSPTYKDRDRTLPLYRQLQFELEDQIMNGELVPGVLLPTEHQMCQRYSVSRITVRTALNELERKGLVERVQGRGTIIRAPLNSTSPVDIHGYTQAMLTQGFTPRSELIEKRPVTGTPPLLEMFGLEPSSAQQLWLFRRLRFLQDEPSVVMNSYVTLELGERMLAYDLGNVSFYSLFETILNQPIHDAGGLITAVAASAENARLLKLPVGSPLVWYRGVTYMEDRSVVEVNYSLFRPDKIMFETQMFKPRTKATAPEMEQVNFLSHNLAK